MKLTKSQELSQLPFHKCALCHTIDNLERPILSCFANKLAFFVMFYHSNMTIMYPLSETTEEKRNDGT